MTIINTVKIVFLRLSILQFAVSLYREMMEAGRDLGVRNAGHSVLDGLRIERLIPQMGKEMTSFVTPREAGVMDRVQVNKVTMKTVTYKLLSTSEPIQLLLDYLLPRNIEVPVCAMCISCLENFCSCILSLRSLCSTLILAQIPSP